MKHFTKFKDGDELDVFKAKNIVGYNSPRMRAKVRQLKQGYRQRERAVLKRELLAEITEWAIESAIA